MSDPEPARATRGNWRYVRDVGRVLSDPPPPHRADAAMPIADVTAAFKSLEETHANGALLAASPSMLAFLEDLQKAYDEFMGDDSETYPGDLVGLISSRLEDEIARARGGH